MCSLWAFSNLKAFIAQMVIIGSATNMETFAHMEIPATKIKT